MDHSSSLNGRALYIAGRIHRFAEQEGWEPGSYLIFASGNPSWNSLTIGVASDHFSKDEYEEVSDESYVKLVGFLQASLADVPGLYESMSINLCTSDDEAELSSLYYPILGDDEVEIDFSALNPGVDDPRAPIARGPARGGN